MSINLEDEQSDSASIHSSSTGINTIFSSPPSRPLKDVLKPNPTLIPSSMLRIPAKARASPVWIYFKTIVSEDPIYKGWVYCQLCKDLIKSTTSSTGQMTYHMQKHHPTEWRQHEKNETTTGKRKREDTQSTLDVASLHQASMDEMHVALIEAMIQNSWSYNSVESSKFRDFLSLISRNKYQAPHRTKLISMTNTYYHNVLNNMTERLQHIESIAVTTDAATLESGDPYICLTGHYIDNKWTLQTMCLGLFFAPEAHTANHLTDLLSRCLERWQIDKKCHVITTDNAANFLRAVRDLRDVQHSTVEESIRCVCHSIHLAVTSALKKVDVVDTLINKCQQIVKTFKGSPKNMQVLRAVKIVGNNDVILEDVWEDLNVSVNKKRYMATDEQIQKFDAAALKPLQLILHVRTRWNSILAMIERLYRMGPIYLIADKESDPLAWWAAHESALPGLAKLAKRYLCIPASSAPSERVWSSAKQVLDRKRMRLLPTHVCQLLYST